MFMLLMELMCKIFERFDIVDDVCSFIFHSITQALIVRNQMKRILLNYIRRALYEIDALPYLKFKIYDFINNYISLRFESSCSDRKAKSIYLILIRYKIESVLQSFLIGKHYEKFLYLHIVCSSTINILSLSMPKLFSIDG